MKEDEDKIKEGKEIMNRDKVRREKVEQKMKKIEDKMELDEEVIKKDEETNKEVEEIIKKTEKKTVKDNIEEEIQKEEKKIEKCDENITEKDKDNLLKRATVLKSPNNIPQANEVALQSNFISHLVLAHGCKNVKPISSLTNTSFCQEVVKELQHFRLDKVYRIQGYMWAHLMRGNSAVIINSAKTGRTLAYLPPICSLVKMHYDDGVIPDTFGPIAIIVAPTSKKVEKISHICRQFFHSCRNKIKICTSYGVRTFIETTSQLLDGCVILVVTPASLSRLLANNIRLFDMSRIRIVVFDDIECKAEDDLWKKFMLTKKSEDHIAFQTVIVSKLWQNLFSKHLTVAQNVMLCIGDYLEAAVYAKTHLTIELRANDQKITRILNFIEDHSYLMEKLIIICNTDEECDDLAEALKGCSHPCTAYTNSSTSDHILLANEWKQKRSNFGEILICTDRELREIQVQNAQNLIHFSLPSSWTKFNFRFSTLLQYYEDLVETNFAKSDKPRARSLVLLDADNNSQLPKLVEFMEKHGQSNAVPKKILQVAKKIKIQLEEERILEHRLFCSNMLEFGCCDGGQCIDRHVLTKFDKAYDGMPTTGTVKFEVISVASPTHYRVRLLEICPPNDSKNWVKIRRSNEFAKFSMEMFMHFSDTKNQHIHWPLKLNDLCVYANGENYQRCQILQIPPNLSEGILKTVKVTIKIIDEGSILTCKSTDILVLPDDYRDLPFQAVDIRLSGVVPFDNEPVWDSKATNSIRKWLTKDTLPNDIILGKVNFALMDSIWVDAVVVIEKIEFLSSYVYKIDVKRSIIEKQIGESSDRCEQFIRAMAEECGIVIQQDEDLHNVSFATAAVESIANDTLTTATSSSFFSSSENALKCESESDWDKASSVNSRKPIYSVVRPRQANRPTEFWEELEAERFTNVYLGAFIGPRKFYVQNIFNKEKLFQLDSLYAVIDEHIKRSPRLIAKPVLGQNCISMYEGAYNRAKVTKVKFDDGLAKVKLFFCDIGFSAVKNWDEVYVSTNYICQFLPYQAIRCKLTGIESTMGSVWPNDLCDEIFDRILDKCDSFYAYPVKCEGCTNDDVLEFYSYEIVLVNCPNLNSVLNVNEEIVKCGLANYDEETRHFLDINFSSTDIHDDELKATRENESDSDKEFDISIDLEEFCQAGNILPTRLKCLPPAPMKDLPKITEITEIEEIDEQTEESPKVTPKVKKTTNKNTHSLENAHKTPKTSWHQTPTHVVLVINAPDVKDYEFKITNENLLLVFELEDKLNVLDLHLFGDIDTKLTAANIIGLNIVVRLVKSRPGEDWPRLTHHKDRNPAIQYDYSQIAEDTDYDVVRVQKTNQLPFSAGSDEEDTESDKDYDTFENPNTFFDPFADDFAD